MHAPQYTTVEGQTFPVSSQLFWITRLKGPLDNSPRLATWLMRSAEDPDDRFWRGLEVDVGVEEGADTKVAFAIGSLLGVTPRYFDEAVVWHPGDHPNIQGTTYVHIGFGRAPDDPGPLLPKPPDGLNMGIFPLDALPDEMRPEHKDLLLGDTLAAAVRAALGKRNLREYFPSRDPLSAAFTGRIPG